MKKTTILIMLVVLLGPIHAQDSIQPPPKPKPVEVKWSGFVLDQLFYDTRKNYDALDGQVVLFPLAESKDSLGKDLNTVPNLNLLSFASRLRCNITGPDAFGATTSGYFEFDFSARANCATVRFRQAWAKLNWKKTELLVGRTWHPMCSIEVLPSVMALSMGAPFQPFNRSDQITINQKAGNFKFILSAIFQNDYTDNGPGGKLYAYQTNTAIPNLHLQAKYKNENTIVGIGIDYKRLRPRTSTTIAKKTVQKSDATIDCLALLAYAQLKFEKLTVSAKTILANNISESLMAGAYGISEYDTNSGHEEYTPYKHWFIWGDVSYGNKLKVSLFAAYLKNLGAGENLVTPIGTQAVVFGLGENIASMIRISPVISYTSGKVMLALEVEHNIALYGSYDYADKGKIINTKEVNGTRLMATMYYNF
jgi:hypothetical protein